MPEREFHRRREPGRTGAAASLPRRSANPVLALQRSIGNRAVSQMLARSPARNGTVQIGGVGTIKVKGSNFDEWETDTLFTVDVTSEKGKHSAKLEKLSKERTRTDVTVTMAPANKAGQELDLGGTILEIKNARIKGYTLKDGVETWHVGDFQDVARKKAVRRTR